MIYLSKGIVKKSPIGNIKRVERCGQEYQLSGEEAALWLEGRFGFSEFRPESEKQPLSHLKRLGLVEIGESTGAGKYRILTQCIFCPAARSTPGMLCSRAEKEILRWLWDAGLHLTVAELIFLKEQGLKPEQEYLHERNRQRLVEVIYTAGTIMDNLLENRMESAKSRD